ncbi:MAG: CoA transferase [Paracoccaceae bacterium]|nr:CoA transferase [Paracoccaceae bacterium]
MAPLSGIRVLDLTNVLAGPFCGHQLVHMGAEVIKVEAPGRGDLARDLGPDPELNARGMGTSFLAQNAGKKSVTINLKHPQGKDLLKRMAAKADVLIENFRPGVMDRLDLGWEVLREVNSRLVYAAISGFGQDGPWRDRPAYDQIIQGASGVMSITGDAKSAPLRVGYPIADTIGGLTAAFAVAAALNARETKGGTFIDVSMLEAVLATMGWAVSNWLISGVAPEPKGNENVTASPSATFKTAEGLLNISANKQEQWEVLCGHLGCPELVDQSEFVTRDDRIANRYALRAALERHLAAKTATAWADELSALGVPAGAVLTVPEVLAHQQIADRGFLETFSEVPRVDQEVKIVRTGVKLDGVSPRVATPPPTLGQHTSEVLAKLGLTEAEIAALSDEGAI